MEMIQNIVSTLETCITLLNKVKSRMYCNGLNQEDINTVMKTLKDVIADLQRIKPSSDAKIESIPSSSATPASDKVATLLKLQPQLEELVEMLPVLKELDLRELVKMLPALKQLVNSESKRDTNSSKSENTTKSATAGLSSKYDYGEQCVEDDKKDCESIPARIQQYAKPAEKREVTSPVRKPIIKCGIKHTEIHEVAPSVQKPIITGDANPAEKREVTPPVQKPIIIGGAKHATGAEDREEKLANCRVEAETQRSDANDKMEKAQGEEACKRERADFKRNYEAGHLRGEIKLSVPSNITRSLLNQTLDTWDKFEKRLSDKGRILEEVGDKNRYVGVRSESTEGESYFVAPAFDFELTDCTATADGILLFFVLEGRDSLTVDTSHYTLVEPAIFKKKPSVNCFQMVRKGKLVVRN